MSQTNNHRDQVQVRVNNVESFYSANEQAATTPYDSRLFNIHPQRHLAFADEELIAILVASVIGSLKAFMAANTAVSIASAVSFQHMWGMMNALQVIVMPILFDLPMPLNV